MSVPVWWARYVATSLLYVPTSPVFSYCTGIYKNYRDNKGRVEIISRMENALMTIGCYLAACRNGDSLYSVSHVQFDHHRGCILVPLSTGVLEYVEALSLYDVIQLVGYDLLALRRLQEIDWHRYSGDDPRFFGYA